MNIKFSIFTPLQYTLNILAMFDLTNSGIHWFPFNFMSSMFENILN